MDTPIPLASAAVAALALLGSACASRRPVAPSGERPPLLELESDVRPVHYRLDLVMDPEASAFSGSAEIDVDLPSARSSLWLHGQGLRVSQARAVFGSESISAEYRQVDPSGVAEVTFSRAVGPGRVSLRLRWDAEWTTPPWDGAFRVTKDGEHYAATQFEPATARRAFPAFDDPQFKTPFDLTLTVPGRAMAISNGEVVETVPIAGDRKRVRFATTAPLPTYLLFWAVGPFEVASQLALAPNDVRPTPLATRVIVPRGTAAAAAFTAQTAAELTPRLERWFGLPFPYSKLDHVVIPDPTAIAMENAGAIAYTMPALEPVGGFPMRQRMKLTDAIAHETAHQWFGDFVTPRWWTDIWLNEAFATWMAMTVVQGWRPEWKPELQLAEDALEAMEIDGLSSARAVRQPLASMSEVNGAFDATTYQKGARVLAMVERLATADAFRDGIRSYLAVRPHGTGSTSDLIATLSRAAGRPLEGIFASFLDQPGMPLVSAALECRDGGARLVLAQTRWLPRGSRATSGERWDVPICARFAVGGAEQERCVVLTEPRGELPLADRCPEWVMPDAGGVGWYQWTLPARDLARLRGASARLSAAERLSVARSAWGAQRAGALPYSDAMATLLALAADPDPSVAAGVTVGLVHARDRLASDAARPSVERTLREVFRPVLASTGWEPRSGEAADTARLRARTIDLLVHAAADPEVRREAARRGRAYASTPGRPLDRSAAAPDIAEAVLAAAVEESDGAFWDDLHERLAGAAPADRMLLLGALAHGRGAATARAAALWHEPGLEPQERLHVVATQASHRETRELAFAAFDAEGETFLDTQADFARAWAPSLLSSGCSVAEARRARTALDRAVARWPELRRVADQAIEAVEICAAERDAEGAALEAFFARPFRATGAPQVKSATSRQ